MSKDYYKILGVDKNVSDDELKKVYRKKCLATHPDRQQGKSEADKKKAEAEFKDINEAYSVLSDKQKRANYDRFGTADVNQGFGGGGFNPHDFFRHMSQMHGFGGGFGDFGFGDDFGFGGFHTHNPHKENPNAPKNGQDIRIRIKIPFEDSIYGSIREFDIEVDDPCEHCNGSGSEDGNTETCPLCHGSGMVSERIQNGFMMTISSHPCNNCNGSGFIIKEKCHVCHGNKTVQNKHHIKINVEQGIDNGNDIKVPNEGIKGTKGGKNGDLYVNVLVDDNEMFHREGLNLMTETYTSPITAILGGNVDIQTPWGKASLKIPSETENGKVFRMSGKGVKSKHGIGDLYVKVNVDVLGNLNGEQKKLLEELKKTITDDNMKKHLEYVNKSEKFEKETAKLRK